MLIDLCFDQINKAIEIFKSKKYDIVTNQLNKKSPKGLSCEVSNLNILRGFKKYKLKKKDKDTYLIIFIEIKKYKFIN